MFILTVWDDVMNEKQKLKGNTGFQEQETVGLSPWMLSLVDELGPEAKAPHWTYSFEEFAFEVIEGKQSLWIRVSFPAGGQIAVRAAYCPDGGVEILVSWTIGSFRVLAEFSGKDQPLLHCTTTLNPVAPLLIPFWPRDVIPLGKEDDLSESEGVIYSKQVKARSGLAYFSLTKPKRGTVLYFQNLTSLNDYAKQTETSLAGPVGGEWPELGFALPATETKTLEADKEIVISDAYLIFSPSVPKDDLAMAKQFLDFLAQVYLALPRAETEYIHWPEIAKKSLQALSK